MKFLEKWSDLLPSSNEPVQNRQLLPIFAGAANFGMLILEYLARKLTTGNHIFKSKTTPETETYRILIRNNQLYDVVNCYFRR